MAMKAWLSKFHVTPRHDLAIHAVRVAEQRRMLADICDGPGGYYTLVTLRNTAPSSGE
jgi:hypothetical protein